MRSMRSGVGVVGRRSRLLSRQMRRHPSTVRDLLKRCGGVRLPVRRRSAWRLSLAEREEISRGLAAGESLRSIAARLRRAPSQSLGRSQPMAAAATTAAPAETTSAQVRQPVGTRG